MSSEYLADSQANHLDARREEYLDLVEHHYARLGSKALRQMKRALIRPANGFWDMLLRPNLRGPSLYVPLSGRTNQPGRSQIPTLIDVCRDDGVSAQGHRAYFANLLRYGKRDAEGRWGAPSGRVHLGPFVIFTLEFDFSDVSLTADELRERRIAFLAEQFGWCRSPGKRDSRLDQLFSRLGQFADFRGITANYGGHKSLHVHVVFGTSHLNGCRIDRSDVRGGLKGIWHQVAEIGAQVLQPPVDADPMLACPEQYRKLPNGTFVNNNPGHIMGVPVGTRVPLLTLWERILQRSPKGATGHFLTPKPFIGGSGRPPSKRHRPTASSCGNLTPEQRVYCLGALRRLVLKQTGGGYPRVADLVFESGEWKLKLWADQHDATAECIISEHHRTILQRGRHRLSRQVDLSLTLGETIRLVLLNFGRSRSEAAGPQRVETFDIAVGRQDRPLRPEEEWFRACAQTKDDVRRIMPHLLEHLVSKELRLLIRGPEGVGKTRSIMMRHPDIMAAIAESEGASSFLSMYAFGTYVGAEEKSLEFNRLGHADYIGVILPSFSRLYHAVCGDHGVRPFRFDDLADHHGGRPLILAIRQEQPEVFATLQDHHRDLWDQISSAGRHPVFFTVHQVLHQWAGNSLTRQFWHPEFFDQARPAATDPKGFMRLRLAVHDELSPDDLLFRHQAGAVDWVKRLSRTAAWRAARNAADQHRAYLEFSDTNPIRSRLDHKVVKVSFEDCRRIDQIDYAGADLQTIREGEPYDNSDDPDGLYRRRHGSPWYAKRRRWWHGVADRVVMLTTELLPTHMVEALNAATRDDRSVSIYQLECPKLLQDRVEVIMDRRVTARSVGRAINTFRDQWAAGAVVVSNRAGHIANTMTHRAVKGSNGFALAELAQTMLHVGPNEYEELCLINQVLGIDQAIRCRHVDEFNQTAGRNLGFRNDGSNRHFLLISPALWGKLDDFLIQHGRFDLDILLNKDQRYEIRRRPGQDGSHRDAASPGQLAA